MQRRKGMTLMELLIVVLILGALSAIAIPRITLSAQNAKVNICKTNQEILNTQMEMWALNGDGSYASLATLTADPNYFPEGLPAELLGGTYSLDGDNRVLCSLGH